MGKNSDSSLPMRQPLGRGGTRGMPVQKAKDIQGTLKRLWKYFALERRFLLLALAFIVLGTAVGLAIPYLMGQAVDSMAGMGSQFGQFFIIVLALLVAYVVDALVRFGGEYLMVRVSQTVVLRLRRALFAKLQGLPLAFFDTHTHGEVMSRIANDLDNVSSIVAQAALQLTSATLMISGSFIFMLILSPPLTLASMVTIPLVFWFGKSISKRTRRLFKEQQTLLGRLNGHVEEMVSGILVVKAFNQEDRVIERFEELNNALRTVGVKAEIWSGFIMPLMNVISNLGFVAVATVGGVLAVKGLVTIGILASFLNYSRQFSRPLMEVASIYNSLQSALASAERVFEILDETEEEKDQEGALEAQALAGEIHFKHVFFSYEQGYPVLQDVSFHVPAGSSLAIVGATGSGKTTIISLLARYYDVRGGEILIDGRDLRNYRRDSLRGCFGVVLQDTYLFSGTIEDNIRYGRLNATQEEVQRAAQLARADGFIKRLPQGYQTELVESGSSLSQGQRQLMAIARAVLADPTILILDEATSSVDTRTELQIQEALAELMKGRTSIIVAHRLSTIVDADQILFLDQGRVVEIGSHKELLEKKGAYFKLYSSQFSQVG